MFSRRRRRRR
ncbi:hypothetical protein LINPERPRIM_LOCUS18619 [Linum perenne]